jgi:hypothetical protein
MLAQVAAAHRTMSIAVIAGSTAVRSGAHLGGFSQECRPAASALEVNPGHHGSTNQRRRPRVSEGVTVGAKYLDIGLIQREFRSISKVLNMVRVQIGHRSTVRAAAVGLDLAARKTADSSAPCPAAATVPVGMERSATRHSCGARGARRGAVASTFGVGGEKTYLSATALAADRDPKERLFTGWRLRLRLALVRTVDLFLSVRAAELVAAHRADSVNHHQRRRSSFLAAD